MDWLEQKQKRLFKEFFEKTGIQLTDDPIYANEWEENNLPDLALEAQTKPYNAIPKLEKLIRERPETPTLKNYLYIAYMYTEQKDKAATLLEQTLEEHPNYVFGVTNKILRAKDKESVLQVGHLLREPMDVREIEGYDKPIHISAYKNYQHAVAHYAMLTENDDLAVQRLDTLMDIGLEQHYLDLVANELAMLRIQNMRQRFLRNNQIRQTVVGVQKVYLTEQTTLAPVLTHQELAIFYQKNTASLTKAQQKAILELPRASLIEDLEKILEDAMKRWDYYSENEYDEDTWEFTLHALYFLGALKAEESLPMVLNLLRMGDEFQEYWFADWMEDVFVPTLYALGEGQLEQLQALALEEGIFGYNKMHVSWVASQVALQQPHRRQEVVQWFQTVFQAFLNDPHNEQLIDTLFLSHAISSITDFKGVELLPLIEQLFANEWIDDAYSGNLDRVKEELNKEVHPSRIDPQPTDIYEYYSKAYSNRKVKPPFDAEIAAIQKKMEGKAEQLISKFWSKALYGIGDDSDSEEEDTWVSTGNYQPIKTIVREGPKVGRNDPCPCGSGKKYKKCCLRK